MTYKKKMVTQGTFFELRLSRQIRPMQRCRFRSWFLQWRLITPAEGQTAYAPLPHIFLIHLSIMSEEIKPVDCLQILLLRRGMHREACYMYYYHSTLVSSGLPNVQCVIPGKIRGPDGFFSPGMSRLCSDW